ncbi:MAG: hypothetical protein U9O97_04900 [Elusimicrobiota bacterium]|nr:hypothetical protein [Elusimicrobiota bacterium]
MSSDGRGDAEKLKKSFAGYVGVVFKNDSAGFQWAAYVYGASANIEKLINQELKELTSESALAPAAEKPVASKTSEKPAEEIESVSEKKQTVSAEAAAAVKEKAVEPKKMEFPKKAQKPVEKISAADAGVKKEGEPAAVTKEEKPAGALKEDNVAAPEIEQFDKKSAPGSKDGGGVKEVPTSAEGAVPASPVIEKFEQLTPDQSAEKPLAGPLIETFEKSEKPVSGKEEAPALREKEGEPEKTETVSPRKDAKPIEVLYLCPETGKDKADVVKENIAKIVAEKNINFDFKSVGVVLYPEGASKESVMEEIAKYKFSFILVVVPDAMGEELLREIKKKGFVPKVITEDNIDKKFRYLNLITDIVLSPRM